MTSRVPLYTASPDIFKAWYAYSLKVAECGLEKPLLELVKIRASQINGCANCLNIHTFEATKAGESQQRIHLVAAWRDAPCYTPRERAALEWTEHMTLIATMRAPDDTYAALAAQFTPAEQVQLTLAIDVINGWNRLAVAFDFYAAELGWQ